jgi:hypothetical protein
MDFAVEQQMRPVLNVLLCNRERQVSSARKPGHTQFEQPQCQKQDHQVSQLRYSFERSGKDIEG